MSERIIPSKVQVAARRAFARTSMQVAAATLPTGGVSAIAVASMVEDPNPVAVVSAVAAWVSAPLIGGAVAYLQVMSSGIPDEYADAVRAIDADDPELL